MPNEMPINSMPSVPKRAFGFWIALAILAVLLLVGGFLMLYLRLDRTVVLTQQGIAQQSQLSQRIEKLDSRLNKIETAKPAETIPPPVPALAPAPPPAAQEITDLSRAFTLKVGETAIVRYDIGPATERATVLLKQITGTSPQATIEIQKVEQAPDGKETVSPKVTAMVDASTRDASDGEFILHLQSITSDSMTLKAEVALF